MNSEPTFLWLDSTAWAAITAIATSALVIVGGLTIISAAIDSRAKSRPNVVAELRAGKYGDRIDLVIMNYGPSAARNVEICLPQIFESIEDDRDYSGNTAWFMQGIKKKYASRLAVIGPGQSESNTWITKRDLVDLREDPDGGTIAPAPEEHLTVSYDKIGWLAQLLKLRYSDTFQLDYAQRALDTNPRSSNDIDRQMNSVIRALEGIKNAVSRIQ